MTVTLRRVAAEERRPTFWEMLAAYLIEDAALDHDLPDDFDPLDFPNFEKYWIEPERSAWWIVHDGVPAGFALVGKYSWSGEPVDKGLIEFCVAPDHRRQHVGEAAANLLFATFPGQWELATAHVSPRAQAFWRHTLAGRPGYREIERDKDRLHRFLGGAA